MLSCGLSEGKSTISYALWRSLGSRGLQIKANEEDFKESFESKAIKCSELGIDWEEGRYETSSYNSHVPRIIITGICRCSLLNRSLIKLNDKFNDFSELNQDKSRESVECEIDGTFDHRSVANNLRRLCLLCSNTKGNRSLMTCN